MFDRDTEISKVCRQLSISADDTIGDLYDDWHNIALSISNRKEGEETPALLAIIRDITVAAYHRRGDEGVDASTVGGQSYTYNVLQDQMTKRILQANLRTFRL